MKTLFHFLKKHLHNHFFNLVIMIVSVFFISSTLLDNSSENKNNKIISPEWNQFQTVSKQDSGTVGVPVDLGPGITETVAEIMERENMLPKGHYTVLKPIENKENEENNEANENLIQSPDSPPVSSWPPRSEDQIKQEQNQTDNPQTVGTSFLGVQFSESGGYVPPDSQGDVGPSQVLVCANSYIKVFSKAGVLGGLNVSLNTFFTSVRNGSNISDTHIRYDRLSGRWFIVTINTSTPNRILIAISSDSTITSSASFTFFQFQQDLVGTPGVDLGGFADYPTLGVDKNALYIGCNMFNGSYVGTSVWVVRKSALIAGTLTVTGFHTISNASGSIVGPRTPQGVDNDDPSGNEGYFIGGSSQFYGVLLIRRVINPGATPTLSGNLSITVPATLYSQSVPTNGAANLDGLDDRLYAAAIHKNKISNTSTLWTSHSFIVNSSGVADASGGRVGSRWYEITNLTTTPSLVQSGTIFDAAGSNPLNYWIPSCVMTGQGHMGIGMTRSGALNKPEISVAGRYRTDANGTTQTLTLAQSSTFTYSLQGGTQRWGDYSQTDVDPHDDMTMWTFQEYCNSANSWGVRAIQLKAPLPATPSSSSVVNIDEGQSSVNIVVTGTSVSGSEFFDPGADVGGPGYAKHISATISGSVTVNSITFNSPTQVTLNISTVGSPVGLKNITVKNPDGQTATGNNLINIQANSNDVLSFNSIMQGFYSSGTNLMVRDSMRVYVRNATSPYAIVDSGKAFLSTAGAGSISFTRTFNSVNYYLVFKHRNSMETWSKSPGQSFLTYALSYDLTTAAAQAYGNNIIQVDASPVKFAVYGGDVDKDGAIDAQDVSDVENASFISLSGYVQTDLTGDDFVDASDIAIVDYNADLAILLQRP